MRPNTPSPEVPRCPLCGSDGIGACDDDTAHCYECEAEFYFEGIGQLLAAEEPEDDGQPSDLQENQDFAHDDDPRDYDEDAGLYGIDGMEPDND